MSSDFGALLLRGADQIFRLSSAIQHNRLASINRP
jgi:hypothetical protein